MKKIYLYLLVCIAFLLFVNSNMFASSISQADVSATLTFEVAVNKTTFVQLEPIPLRLTIKNSTNTPLNNYTALNFSHGQVKALVTNNGKTREITRLSSLNTEVYIPGTKLSPGEREEITEIWSTDLDKIFSEAGEYYVQFLVTNKSPNPIKSNVLKIEIVKPQLLDYEALQFLKKYGDPMEFFESLSLTDSKEDPDTILEAFVVSYGESSYGNYATYRLGKIYINKKMYREGKELLEKIVDRPNQGLKELILYNLIEANFELNNFDKAKSYTKQLREVYPKSPYLQIFDPIKSHEKNK